MDRSTSAGNPRFFACTGPHPLRTVAEAAGCSIPAADPPLGDPPLCGPLLGSELAPAGDLLLTGMAALETAGPSEISFVGHRRHATALARTCAGAVLVSAVMRDQVPAGSVALITADPPAAWAQVAKLFHPAPTVRPGIHRSAVVADGAVVDATANVCAQAVIDAHAEIGARCMIGPGAVIGEGVVLGPDCRIGAHVSISHAILGARVTVFPGARIGQEGFGFTISPNGFETVPQLGLVILEDDVEVGANTTIDRGSLRDTVVGAGTRLDNLVQVAHNVRIGRHCAVAALVGISGSAEIGDFVVVGGQAGVADHVRVGTRARVGAQSGVMSDLDPGVVVVGSPARPVREVFREIATLKRLARPNQA
jgi:UDP-3-O-[3-hydroxymyristoyl] glucosamine N-acyltransferase